MLLCSYTYMQLCIYAFITVWKYDRITLSSYKNIQHNLSCFPSKCVTSIQETVSHNRAAIQEALVQIARCVYVTRIWEKLSTILYILVAKYASRICWYMTTGLIQILFEIRNNDVRLLFHRCSSFKITFSTFVMKV